MKIKYIILIIIMTLFNGCIYFYTESAINKRYIKLNTKLDKLMDDKINENDRAKLEDEYSEFISDMNEYKKANPKLDTIYLDKYIQNSKRKLGYIKDMKD